MALRPGKVALIRVAPATGPIGARIKGTPVVLAYINDYDSGAGGDDPTTYGFFGTVETLKVGGSRTRTLSVSGGVDPSDTTGQQAVRTVYDDPNGAQIFVEKIWDARDNATGVVGEQYLANVTDVGDSGAWDDDFQAFTAAFESAGPVTNITGPITGAGLIDTTP